MNKKKKENLSKCGCDPKVTTKKDKKWVKPELIFPRKSGHIEELVV